MSELAQALFCDNSNVTGIVDRLEERGLVRREAAEGDRRVKLLVLTKEGERMRVEITKRMAEPPPPIASLSEKDQRQLRDILKRAVEGISDAEAAAAAPSPGKAPAAGQPESPLGDLGRRGRARRLPPRRPSPRGGTRGTRARRSGSRPPPGWRGCAPRMPNRVLPKSTATRTMKASIFVARFWICGWIR